MSGRFFCVLALFLLNWFGKCEVPELFEYKFQSNPISSFGVITPEPSENTLGNNYEQIFHSLPTLFEYLLEMLEDQSGLLEKNDVSFFQNSVSKHPKEEVKREIKESNIQIDEFDGNFKDFTDDTALDIPETVSRSNYKSAAGEFPKALRIGEVVSSIEERKPKENNDFNKKYISNSKIQDSEMVSKVENKYKRDKRNDKKIFAGSIDRTEFFVTADEVEENSIKVEQAIEDYNRNKNKNR